MKKSGKFVGLLLLATVLLFAGCQRRGPAAGDSEFGPPIELTFATTSSIDDLITQAANKMKGLIEERSGGQMTVNVFPASQLGNAMAMMEMVSDGAIDLLIESSTFLSNFGVPNAHLIALPFLVGSVEEFVVLNNSSFMQELFEENLRVNNIRIIGSNWIRPWSTIASKSPVRTLEDWNGLRVRIPPVEFLIHGMARLGLSPTPVAYGETLMALQQGVVDAGWIRADAVYTMRWFEATDYLIKGRFNIDTLFHYFSERTFRSMTPAQQEILIQASHDAGEWYVANSEAAVARAAAAVQAAGMQIIHISDEEWRRWQAQVAPMAQEFEASGTRWRPGQYARVMRIMAGLES